MIVLKRRNTPAISLREIDSCYSSPHYFAFKVIFYKVLSWACSYAVSCEESLSYPVQLVHLPRAAFQRVGRPCRCGVQNAICICVSRVGPGFVTLHQTFAVEVVFMTTTEYQGRRHTVPCEPRCMQRRTCSPTAAAQRHQRQPRHCNAQHSSFVPFLMANIMRFVYTSSRGSRLTYYQ